MVNTNQILAIYPFRLKRKRISLDDISSVKWNSYTDVRATYYRVFKIRSKNNVEIKLCDKEFENLDSIAKTIDCKSVKKTRYYQSQKHKY